MIVRTNSVLQIVMDTLHTDCTTFISFAGVTGFGDTLPSGALCVVIGSFHSPGDSWTTIVMGPDGRTFLAREQYFEPLKIE